MDYSHNDHRIGRCRVHIPHPVTQNVIFPPKPPDDTERLQALDYYDIMDSETESDYDAIVNLASKICDTPISLVTLINENRQWFKAKIGIERTETPRELAFCAFTILENELLEVEDTHKDERFVAHPLVDGDPNIRFYAGMPLRTPSGYNLGSLCVIDNVPRRLSDFQRDAMKTLSEQVIRLFELRRKNKELNALQQVQNRLMSIIGHDLRSPIASIQTLLELCDEYDMEMDDFKRLLPDIRKNADSTSELVINLLDWTQSQMNGLVLNRQPLVLREIAESVIDDNQTAITAKKNLIINDLPAGKSQYADRRMVEFLFRNLILNANKFTSSGSIRLHDTDGIIHITDSGVGIPETKISELFDWETRSSTPGTNSERGSGLGLPMSHEFVAAHGGKIWVESRLGSGTTIFFTLP